MPNQQLLDYIIRELEQGVDLPNIAQTLLRTGWSEEEINLAISYLFPPEEDIDVPLPPPIPPSMTYDQQTTVQNGPVMPIKEILNNVPTSSLAITTLVVQVLFLFFSVVIGATASFFISIFVFLLVLVTTDRFNTDFKRTPRDNVMRRILLLLGTGFFLLSLLFEGVSLVLYAANYF